MRVSPKARRELLNGLSGEYNLLNILSSLIRCNSDMLAPASFQSRRLLIASRCAKTMYSQRLNLARAARNQNWDVILAGQLVEGPYRRLIHEEGLHFYPLSIDQSSLNILGLVKAIFAFRSLCRQQRPDVFHAFTIKPTVAGLIGAWLARVPTRVATVAGLGHIFVSSPTLIRLCGTLLLRLSLLAAHRVYFYNENDRQTYISRGIVNPTKTKLIAGSGVDTSRYTVSDLPNDERFHLLYIGRIIREKGIDELLSAMQMVQSSRPVVLHVVGDLDHHNPSSLDRKTFETRLLAVNGVWHGHSNNVVGHIASADVVILPSYSEGIPLALLEAGASGRAMIATDVPGCRDVVRDGTTGFLVPLGDVSAMARAIEKMADDPCLVARMGKRAREDIVARFDTLIVNGQMVDDYEKFHAKYFVHEAMTGT
jgi:glycosyltransferase involved in cell wall biosynthesis